MMRESPRSLSSHFNLLPLHIINLIPVLELLRLVYEVVIDPPEIPVAALFEVLSSMHIETVRR